MVATWWTLLAFSPCVRRVASSWPCQILRGRKRGTGQADKVASRFVHDDVYVRTSDPSLNIQGSRLRFESSLILIPVTSMGQKLSLLLDRKGQIVDSFLEVTVNGLEASKDVIAAAAPVPGLSVALNITIEILKMAQVRAL